MLILSLDCAGSGCGVCVWRDGEVLSEQTASMERGQDQRLMPMIMDVMKQAGVEFEQLDRIAVTNGPGSFTGIRIGLAAARGLGLASGKPVIGIDRFSIFRDQHKRSNQNHLVIINSRRKELYCRYYPNTGIPEIAAMMTPEEITAYVENEGEVIISGDVSSEMFKNYQHINTPEHVVCAKIAAIANPSAVENLPRPLYIRAPDAMLPKKIGISIHPLTILHAPLLAELHAESFVESKWSLQQIQSSLTLDTTQGLGAYDGEALVGFILCQIIPDQSEVLTFCVRPAYRKRGIGTELLRIASEIAYKSNSSLYLEVAANNAPALALYNKIGFVRTGIRPNYYQSGDGSVDAMLLTLQPSSQTA